MASGMSLITAEELISLLEEQGNAAQRNILMRFFRTGKGEYGEGDEFLGLKVPQTRAIVKEARLNVPFDEIRCMLYSAWHEVRLCGLLLLVEEMKAVLPGRRNLQTCSAERRREIACFYLAHARQANNWDLVDLSCPVIIGEWIFFGGKKEHDVLDKLAASDNLWEQRIAVVSTLALIRHGQYEDTLRISEKSLRHTHDLIHKATGWMLREVGKRDVDVLRGFLESHWAVMPRTALRYAIERMPEHERMYWLRRK